jgi:hypothetical protein
MEDYEIIFKNDKNRKRKLILYMDDFDLKNLLDELNLIDLNGGQFTWGYHKRSNEGTIIISFRKVELTSKEDSISYQNLLEVIVRGALLFFGLYYLFHYIVPFKIL